MSKMRMRIAVAAACALALAAAGAIAYAAIPAAGTNVINGCYDAKSGSLRVIDTAAGAGCAKNEKAIFWNQQGPRGEQGVPGETGAPGAAGASVAAVALAAGDDPVCPSGGTKFTVGDSVSYACNGATSTPVHRGSWTLPAHHSDGIAANMVELYGSPLSSGAASTDAVAMTEMTLPAGGHVRDVTLTLKHELPFSPWNTFVDGELVVQRPGQPDTLVNACMWREEGQYQTCAFPDLELPASGPVLFKFVLYAWDYNGQTTTIPPSTVLYSWRD